MKNQVFFVFSVFLLCIATAANAMQRSNTPTTMQAVYKQITNELVTIRKEHKATQPRVYAILDQVDRMNTLSKTMYQKKQKLEQSAAEASKQMHALEQENQTLKGEIDSLKQKLEITTRVLEQASEKLIKEKNRAKSRSQECKNLQGKITQIERDLSTKNLHQELNEKVSKSVEAEVAAQLQNLAAAQNLSLTSTSAPSSPR
ncbi:MAG: hypothetical protein US69_C0002G0077 [candidate division TM6 bacterium GW2011_GWF2_38_10]|nr:MAG: hypothetical protein US69_C0002G0077 [candidate division TM6 bacterium GW2011_GWF2_38_10]